ncbi:MAG: VOC family protein [Blastocatellia bacterium]
MKLTLIALLAGAAALLALAAQRPVRRPTPGVALTTVALRVHRMEQMTAFYSQAFGVKFREVDTFGIRSQFGEVAGLTLKFVPIRAGADFTEYPIHQLGFTVPDVEAVIALALKHGGKQEGPPLREKGRLHAAIRDPDGNTLELYARQ